MIEKLLNERLWAEFSSHLKKISYDGKNVCIRDIDTDPGMFFYALASKQGVDPKRPPGNNYKTVSIESLAAMSSEDLYKIQSYMLKFCYVITLVSENIPAPSVSQIDFKDVYLKDEMNVENTYQIYLWFHKNHESRDPLIIQEKVKRIKELLKTDNILTTLLKEIK